MRAKGVVRYHENKELSNKHGGEDSAVLFYMGGVFGPSVGNLPTPHPSAYG